jgi:hypothetical protein
VPSRAEIASSLPGSRAVVHNAWMRRAVLVVLALAGCGRLEFDARGNAGDANGDSSSAPSFTYSNAMGWGTLNTGTSYTQSYTVNGASPAILVVTAGGDSTSTVDSVTFAGLPLIRAGESICWNIHVSMFYLLGPPAITGDLVATYPQPMGRAMMAVVLEGVAAASPVASGDSRRSNGPISTTVSVSTAPAVLVDALGTYNATGMAAVGEVDQVFLGDVAAGGYRLSAMSLMPVATTGSKVMSWEDQAGATEYCQVVLAFADD